MKPPPLRYLATLTARLAQAQTLGETPRGVRKIVPVVGGTLEGPRISGEILPGGGDWALTTTDGVLHLDVRLTIQTDDGAPIFVQYAGIRHGTEKALNAMARGAPYNPEDIYFRIQPLFETADKRYQWLNKIICVGVGERLPDGPRYQIFEVL